MLKPFVGTESVTRHRGRVRDENGKLTAETTATLLALGVAPGGGTDRVGNERTGEDIACTVYFPAGTDIVNGDELTVRGKRFQIVVNNWQLPSADVGGLQVQCVRSEG